MTSSSPSGSSGIDDRPGIIYSLVSRGTTVLAEFTLRSYKGNFAQITRLVLEKIPTGGDSKMSYLYDQYFFHYMVSDGIIYLCMADERFGRRLPFAFLEDIKNRFVSTYGNKGKTAVAYAMNSDFKRVLKQQMDYYTNDPNVDKIRKVRNEIEQVKAVMVNNIDTVIARGEKIDLLVEKTGNLASAAFTFKKTSTALRRAVWWQNIKLMVLLAIILIGIAIVAVLYICGPTFSKCRSHHTNPAPTPQSSFNSTTIIGPDPSNIN